MFSAGGAVDGKPGIPRIATTVCPARVLAQDDGDALETVEWWLNSTMFGEMSAQPVGPPEWPLPGGLLNQPAKLVEAAQMLRGEWPHVLESRAHERKATPIGGKDISSK